MAVAPAAATRRRSASPSSVGLACSDSSVLAAEPHTPSISLALSQRRIDHHAAGYSPRSLALHLPQRRTGPAP